MKKDIHPKYYPKAEIVCTCGAKFNLGSTLEKAKVELCSRCHPFYTGQKRVVDTAGRVQKFEARIKKTEEIRAKRPLKKKVEKKVERKTKRKEKKRKEKNGKRKTNRINRKNKQKNKKRTKKIKIDKN